MSTINSQFSFARPGLAKLGVFLGVFFFFLVLFFAVVPASAQAADFYWYGGTGNWSDYTNHWSLNSGNSPANPAANAPTSTDNCHFDANSFTGASQTVTVDAAANCLDMDWTGATNTPTLTQAASISAYGAVTFIAAMTMTSASQDFYFAGSGATSLTTNGLSFGVRIQTSTTFTGTLTLLDNLTLVSRGFFHNSGTVNTNSKAVSVGYFTMAGTAAKTLTLGASIITITDATGWNYSGSNLTLTANTATINIGTTGAFNGGNITTYNNINLNGTAHTVSGNFTANVLTRNGTATKTDSVTFTSGNTVTVTTFAMIGWNAASGLRLLVQSSVLGSPATITATNWTGSQSFDLMDITATNAIDLSGFAGGVGDAGGNTNITFTTAAAQTWTPTSGTAWSTAANWTSRVPLPQDDVTAGGTGNTITVDMPRIGKSITFTGTPTVSLSNAISNYGSWTMVSGMTYTHNNNDNYFRGRGTNTLTTAGKTLYQFYLSAPSGTMNLQDTLSVTIVVYIMNGTFNFNNQSATLGLLSSTGSRARTITMGSGTITLNRTTAGINKVELSGSNFTFNANTSTIILTNSTANAQAFVGGNSTFNNVTVQGSGNYVTTVSGSNTFNTFTVDRSQAAKTIKFTAGTTQTFSNFIAATSGTTVLTIDSDTTATHALVKTGGGTISSDYLNIQHSVATPANTWYAGANSTNNQATATAGSGWIFSAAYKTLVGKDIGAYQVMTDGTNVYGYINTTNVVSAAIDNTKWHHVVMTYDGATQKIYVDGVLQNSGAVSGAIGTNSSNVEIGQNFAGKIDNVRIYNRALSQTEVTAAYDSYNPGIQISDLQKGLVGQWKMNGNANDSTSYQNNGTVTGATLTTDRKGQVNKAYSFDGVGNYVNVGDPTNGSLDFGTGDFSISMWAKVQSNTSGLAKGILDKSGFGTTAGYSLFHIEVGDERGSNLVGFSIEDSTGVHNEVDSTSVVGNNQWHHIVGTFISSSDTLSIYVDGKLEKTDSDTALGNISSSGNLYLGARNNGTAVENGLIDEVRIWNRALSADEITALYQEYDPGIAVSNLQKGLVGQWKFDGNANDSTSYQNNGTVTGATLTTDRKGQVNKAYSFNGTSDYINAGNGASLNITGDITIAVWAKMNNVSGIYNLVGNTRTSYYGYRFIISAGQLGFNTVQSGANQLTYSSPILTTGVWYHLVATRSGTVAKTYINGEDKTSTPATHIDPVSSAATLKIGVYSYSPTTQFFRGLIDEVRVWNRALSAAEVKALYESY